MSGMKTALWLLFLLPIAALSQPAVTGATKMLFFKGDTTFRATVTELLALAPDQSATNELQTLINTSNSTTHTVTLSNSGGSVQLAEGSGITLTTTGTSADGVVTIAATGGGGTNYQTFRDDGAGMTQRAAANFVSTSTVTATLTDDAGNNETEVALSVPTDGVTATQIAADAVGASELASTAVSAGSYTYASLTVDADGRLTAASNGTAPVLQNGNSFGTTMTVGTNDANALNLETNGSTRVNVTSGGRVFVGGPTTPTAVLHLAAGSSSVAPLKLTPGAFLTTPEDGAIEFDGNNLTIGLSFLRYIFPKTFSTTSTLNFPSTAAQSSSDLTVSLSGASLGNVVYLGTPTAAVLANSCYTAWVSATGVVTVRFSNYSSAAQDPASGSFRVAVAIY